MFLNGDGHWQGAGAGQEVLRELIQRGEIPPHDILMLSCRDDLIEQLKQHVHQRKIDGYSAIFEKASGEKKDFNYNGKTVKVFAFLHTADKDGLPAKYRKYWFDNVEEMSNVHNVRQQPKRANKKLPMVTHDIKDQGNLDAKVSMPKKAILRDQ